MEILNLKVSQDILHRNELGRLACFSPEADETYIVPISYRYDHGLIYFACLPGQKLRYIHEHPAGVSLEVDEVDETQQWSTVIVTGKVTEASGWDQVEQGLPTMRRLTRGPLRTQFSAGSCPESMAALVMCVLHPTKISGRKDYWVLREDPPEPLAPKPHVLAGHLAG
jgi:nitroimidazol reductase NimA-like FMN-containing flavoprotein (pyridoxamine 5'-phosphate oxidase superfamily)